MQSQSTDLLRNNALSETYLICEIFLVKNRWFRNFCILMGHVKTRGPKGHISCTWVQCATFFDRLARAAIPFSDLPKKHKLGRGCWDLSSCQVSLNSVQRFQRRSPKCLSQSEARAAILFSNRPKKHKLGTGRWDLASCQVSLNSVQWFQKRSPKCLSQSEARAVILFFRSPRKTQTW